MCLKPIRSASLAPAWKLVSDETASRTNLPLRGRNQILKDALRSDMLPLHFTPDLQLETGVHSTAAQCNNNPRMLPSTHPIWIPDIAFLKQEEGQTQPTDLMREAGWCERWKRGCPQTVPSNGTSDSSSTSNLLSRSCHPQTWDRDDITFNHWWDFQKELRAESFGMIHWFI